MDLIASRPLHGIKTRGSAIASFFSFLVAVPDFVNPRFILDFDTEVGNHIDTLVLAVRTITDRRKKQVYHSLRKDGLAFRILNIIREWSIEAIHRELTYLQSRPRRLPIQDCAELTLQLYRPIMQLERVEPLFHISRAVQFAYRQHVQTLPKSSPEIERLRKNLLVAQEEIGYVFGTIKRRCYPLLMKMTSTRCLDVNAFFRNERDAILQFLDLAEQDQPAGRSLPIGDQLESLSDEELGAEDADASIDAQSLDGASDDEDPDASERSLRDVDWPFDDDSDETERDLYGAVYQGLTLLDRLFPDAGWLKLDTYPDLYAYFQPLLSLPRGFELLPREDALTPIVVLVAVLRELFYTYRDMRFGGLRDENGEQVDLGEIMEELLDSWHRYLDEIIGGEYVTRIVEYCRHVERHPDFQSSQYAKRLEAELAWIKAKQLTRWAQLVSARGLRIPPSHSLPPLHERVGELRDFLTRVALDIDDARDTHGTCATIENPWADPVFPVKSTVSHRFMKVLTSTKRGSSNADGSRCTNADVIFATVSMLYVLEYITADDSNPYAAVDSSLTPYRGIEGRGGEPAYVVDLRPTQKILSDYEAKESDATEQVTGLIARDEITGLKNTFTLREEIRQAIARYDEQKEPFTVLGAAIRDLDVYRRSKGDGPTNTLLEAFAVCVHEVLGEGSSSAFRLDDDSFLLLLSGVRQEDAVEIAGKLFTACLRYDPSNLQTSLAVVPFYRTWGPERLLKTVSRAVGMSVAQPYPVCLVHDSTRSSYQILDLLDDIDTTQGD